MRSPWWQRTRLITTVLINLGNIMERADEQILPAVYIWVAASFEATPKQLGFLTLSRALVQALASPLGGIMGHHYNRITVVTIGCLLWGVMTALFSVTQSLQQGMILSAVNGVGLAFVIPNAQSLTADYYLELDRGKAFGALYMTSAIGGALGSLYATSIGGHHPLGIEGWRFVFLSVGIISFILGILNWCMAHDPRYAPDKRTLLNQHRQGLSAKVVLQELGMIMRIPSFLIIIGQGIAGSIPFQAIAWLTTYYQLLGFSDGIAALLMFLFLFSTAFGGLLGGYIGDRAATLFPNHGRIVVTQFSIGVGIPLTMSTVLQGLPFKPKDDVAAANALVLTVTGLLISWAAPACNNPIFAEIVPAHLRNLIYAFDRSFEMAIAACATPLVGAIAEKFGFEGAATRSEGSRDISKDLSKAKALGNALLLCLVVPWAICLVVYTALHLTYPKDKRKALALQQQLASRHQDDPAVAETESPRLPLRDPTTVYSADLDA
eukprot:jgi/Astpho2/173/e_gw1.00004.7.1_t